MSFNFQLILDKILKHPLVCKTQLLLKRIVIPGFDGVPIFDVLVFFVKGLIKGELARRASSLSYNFIMAIFPLILFFFTVIAYLPLDNFVATTYEMIENFLPEQSFAYVKNIIDGILQKNSTLLSFSILFAFYFATRGTRAMINELNATYHDVETRSFIKKKFLALFMLFVLVLLFIITIAINIAITQFVNVLLDYEIIRVGWTLFLIKFIKWLLIVFLVFVCISVIYYFAPVRKRAYHFFSAGSSLATLLIVLSSAGFNFYINNFSRYNVIYGSIGTLIVLLLWIQLISMILLIGFELNVSIRSARLKQQNGILIE